MSKNQLLKEYIILSKKSQYPWSRGLTKAIFLFCLIFIFGFWSLIFGFSLPVRAMKIDELKSQISRKNQEMAAIQKEIDEYKDKLGKTSKEAGNLKNQIKTLENTLYKIKGDIKLAQNRIEAANLSIEELSVNIGSTKVQINQNIGAVAETIRLINEADSNSLVEILLAYDSLSDFFDNLNAVQDFEKNIALSLQTLKSLKTTLENQKLEIEGEKNNLETKKEELLDKQEIQKNTQTQKSELFKQTKNKETLYKNLLEERLKKQEALEQEISAIEEEIRIAIDPESLPKSGAGVLLWPLEQPIVITQYFGNTAFATQNPQIYGGKGHNGIDFRASIGTAIKASEDGIVRDIGNTDIACDGVSYGEWALIDHSNNLSTLYSHLSLIKVKSGSNIKKGDIIGYSGNSGYTTGPHLHFAVFASKAVKVDSMRSKVCGTMMKLPLAPYNGYLNPLSYL